MAPDEHPQHGFDWEGTPAPDPATAPAALVAPSRRVGPRLLFGAAGAVAIVAVAVIALSGGGGSGPGGSGGSSPVTLAADATTREPGFKFNMTIGVSAAGQNLSFTGTGAIDTGPPQSGSFSMNVDGVTVNERIVGSSVYIQSPTSPGSWEQVNLSGLQGLSGDGASASSPQLDSADPSATLNYLRASGTVTNEGSDTIDGVATTRYHALVDLSTLAASLPASQQAAAQQSVQQYEAATGSTTLPIDVWIDGSNLVRQIDFDMNVNTASGQASVTYSMGFYDYGPQAAVSAPPANEITTVPTPQQTTPASPASPSTSTPATPATPSTPSTIGGGAAQ
jgi:hypothetical protein